ncbi:MAG TPA: tryptophan synthase subunit alpha, partial [Myxococcota bacterium]|nr:tryptophan synthase subunit alpha [Myxococcota bacterium]
MTPADRLERAIRSPRRPGRPAVMPYLVAGHPDPAGWDDLLLGVSDLADAIELGVPFSDPMADGPVIQRAGRRAIDAGVSLRWILDGLASLPRAPGCPIVLMSYLNPLLQYGLATLVDRAAEIDVAGFIVPDLPWEEGAELRGLCEARGLALIQLVTPVTPDERVRRLGAGRGGFTYAVTITGITGGSVDLAARAAWLDRVRALSERPVCAGFGIRSRADVE